MSRAEYDQRSARYRRLIRSVIDDFPTIKLFDPTGSCCDDVRCNGFFGEFGYLYRDVDQLSEANSVFFVIKLAESLIAE